MTRYGATAIQAAISALALSCLAYLVLVHWYPGFFAQIDGAWVGLRIIAGIEIVLGPALTLILFKPGKAGLKFDMAVTGLLRALCLIAGTWIIYTERPLFFIYYDAAFYSANADTYARYDQSVPDPADFDTRTPALVISAVPDNPIEEADFRKILYDDGLPIWIYQHSYRPMTGNLSSILDKAVPPAQLEALTTRAAREYWRGIHSGDLNDFAFYPVVARYLTTAVGIRKTDGTPAGVIALEQQRQIIDE